MEDDYFKKLKEQKEKKKKKFSLNKIIIVSIIITIFLLLIAVIMGYKINIKTINIIDKAESYYYAQKNEKIENRPKNGKIYLYKEYPTYNKKSFLEIKNKRNEDVLIRIEYWDSNIKIEDIYVHKNSIIKANVPFGKYKIKIASGSKWKNIDRLFGITTTYEELEKQFHFYESEEKDTQGTTTITHSATISLTSEYSKGKRKKINF